MRTYLKGLCGAAVLAATASLAMQTPAEAQGQGRCVRCGSAPITKTNTVYRYRTVNRVHNVTRFKDVNHTRFQRHVTRVVHVTRVQPIQRVHLVTRVHNRMVILRQTQNVAQTTSLPMRTVTTGKTIHINHAPTFGTCCR
ncbi:MAG TPA: hypothetical protein VH913_22125 [Hyphomicrobiaceae bacterium]|jgi:hypothetical protein